METIKILVFGSGGISGSVAVARGRGPWPWPVAVARGRGPWPWSVAVVRGCGPWPWSWPWPHRGRGVLAPNNIFCGDD